MDFEKHIRFAEDGLDIHDMNGELKSLPGDFFDRYQDIKFLSIHGTGLTALPVSFGSLKQLIGIRLYKTKIKTLPPLADLSNLSSVYLYSNSIDLNKEALNLAALPSLSALEVNGYRGNTFPAAVSMLKTLRRLRIGSDLKKKATIGEIIAVVEQLPELEELYLGIPLKTEDFTQDFLKLDRLKKISFWFFPAFHKPQSFPLIVGCTKHVLFDGPIDEVLKEFRTLTAKLDLTQEQTKVLMGIRVRNLTALNAILPNTLKENLINGQATNLILLDKPKGESAKSLREKFASHPVTIAKNEEINGVIVIGDKTNVEEALPYVMSGRKVITVDHLKEVLVSLTDPWLMQKENESSNDQLLQLLASNQTDNLKVAFQIIEGGGANEIVQAFLAAIMLAHPDTSIAKAAEKLYDRFGSQSFKLHAKKSGISLRQSSRTEWKVNQIVHHPEIDGFAFRLMHHAIASANKNIVDVQAATFHIKGVENLTVSRALPFFSHFRELNIESCPGVAIQELIELLIEMKQCKVLKLANCKVQIPPAIRTLTHLEELDLSSNILESPDSLGDLTSLTSINLEGTKINSWNFLSNLTALTTLNINRCGLANIPEEVYALHNLSHLEAKQNQITDVADTLSTLTHLNTLDLSSNRLTVFPYSLGRLRVLNVLMLRSNGINTFEVAKVKAEAGSSNLSWVELGLSRTNLKDFSLEGVNLPSLRVLDISYNQIDSLHDSIFTNTGVIELYAEGNNITGIPPSISSRPSFRKLWLQNNRITRLENYMARIRIENCDVSANNITFIHPDFDIYGKDSHARLYWKIAKNPISPTLCDFGGLYGGR